MCLFIKSIVERWLRLQFHFDRFEIVAQSEQFITAATANALEFACMFRFD
jgi:hypothetical protein